MKRSRSPPVDDDNNAVAELPPLSAITDDATLVASTVASSLEVSSAFDGTISRISALSVLVITYAGKWSEEQFLPSPLSVKKIDWFEGTGTVIGLKRNTVYILTSIHCNPDHKYSYFVKGEVTNQVQTVATLVTNQFMAAEDGIDIAVFSCDISAFNRPMLDAAVLCLRSTWQQNVPLSMVGEKIWLVHFPTVLSEQLESTHRLINPVFPSISSGEILSVNTAASKFDSTITATGGSSGGLLVDIRGKIIGTHDSQHDENPLFPYVSTHQMISELSKHLSEIRQIRGLFE